MGDEDANLAVIIFRRSDAPCTCRSNCGEHGSVRPSWGGMARTGAGGNNRLKSCGRGTVENRGRVC